jgi:protein-disulfide isomerase
LDRNALLNNIRETQDLPVVADLQMGDLQPSDIPGFKTANLTIVYRQNAQPVVRKIYVSDDNRHYVLDGFSDLTINPDQERIRKVDISKAPILGNKKAPVTVISFVDFQCPFCDKAFDFQSRILKDYDGKVRLVYKSMPLPFHPWARKAAIAMQCAGQMSEKKSWAFYNSVFQHQAEISKDQDPSARLMDLAKEADLSSPKFLSCMEDPGTIEAVKQDMEEAQSVGVDGTPAFLVNGHLVVGADEQTLRLRIDESLQGKHGKYE